MAENDKNKQTNEKKEKNIDSIISIDKDIMRILKKNIYRKLVHTFFRERYLAFTIYRVHFSFFFMWDCIGKPINFSGKNL